MKYIVDGIIYTVKNGRVIKEQKLRTYEKKRRDKKKPRPPITQSYIEFLRTKYWSEVRKKVLRRDKYRCKRCGSKDNLQVHHLTYKYFKSEFDNIDCLVTLCIKCHKTEHNL